MKSIYRIGFTGVLLIALLLLSAALAWPQSSIFDNVDFVKFYTASREATLSAAAETVTIQQPATNSGQNFLMDSVEVYCSVACTFTIERNGTAATTTSFTPVAANPGVATARATAFHTSNVGAGTEIGKYWVAAAGEKVISLRGLRLRANTRDNLTVKTSSITGTARVLFRWAETRP